MTNTNEILTGATEVSSSWFKFDKVGATIKGTILSKKIQKSNTPAYKDQLVVELKQENDEVWNVGISVAKAGTVQRLQRCAVGEIIAIQFESEGESAIKGGFPAKNLKVYTFGMDPNFHLDSDIIEAPDLSA